jgi:hypothetical protein
MNGPKDVQTETPKARPGDFALICAAAVDFVDLLGIWEIVESVTYMFSMRPIAGAPYPAFATWDSTNSD